MTSPAFSTATGSDVRVRFCPSPTGTPHVGLVRTALFNWAYARHTGGTLIFRIEDTDTARDSEESYHQLLDALRWLGIDWDEGVEVGGPHAPYRQSQRGEIYTDIIQRLTDAGHLYESYLTPDEIEARNIAAGRDPKMGYDNAERELTDEQRAAYRAEGRQPALRLRVPDTALSFTDLVRGEITFPQGSFVDFVVVRPNGAPLYTFVNPVDDALMGVTHVLRGEDLLSSTPRQIALYHALIDIGVTDAIPQFGHLPFVMGEGNRKLSKRDPESNLFHHRDRGFIPEGLLNYLSLLGWSLSHDRDVFTLDELIAAFDVRDVNPNPARFDQKKAEAINGDHVRRLPSTNSSSGASPTAAARASSTTSPARRSASCSRGPRPSCRSAWACSARSPAWSASCSRPMTTSRSRRMLEPRSAPTQSSCSTPASARSSGSRSSRPMASRRPCARRSSTASASSRASRSVRCASPSLGAA